MTILDTFTIATLRATLDAENISMGELALIDSAWEYALPVIRGRLRDHADNATAADELDELDVMTEREKAAAFFYHNAGTSYDPATETAEEGKVRGACALADAEAWLATQDDLRIDWAPDWDGDHSYTDEPVETCEYAALTNGNVDVLASVGCIDDATDDYRRVVEAELAAEAKRAAEAEPTVTDAQRIAYAVERLTRWEGNYRTNAGVYRARGDHGKALDMEVSANNTADVIKMLDGTDDAYILQLAKR